MNSDCGSLAVSPLNCSGAKGSFAVKKLNGGPFFGTQDSAEMAGLDRVEKTLGFD
jgi:hypothetical protein